MEGPEFFVASWTLYYGSKVLSEISQIVVPNHRYVAQSNELFEGRWQEAVEYASVCGKDLGRIYVGLIGWLASAACDDARWRSWPGADHRNDIFFDTWRSITLANVNTYPLPSTGR
jgi:hypothetical protein